MPAHLIAIVGGGVSGVLMACHLLKADKAGTLHVVLIERRSEIGRGLALSTHSRSHILNVRAGNMSAFPDEPDHFWNWLRTSDHAFDELCADPFCFVPRSIYGQYIESLIAEQLADGSGRLTLINAECRSLRQTESGLTLSLDDGSAFEADQAILATGHDQVASPGYEDPWSSQCLANVDKQASLLVLGSGLTMVDFVLSAIQDDHEGSITVVSRRGLQPKPHRRADPLRIEASSVPFGASISRLMAWLRRLVRESAERGMDWRSVIDGLRPHTQALWQRLPMASRKSFLTHARPWWDVYRHRMAPQVETRLSSAVLSGQVRVMAGRLMSLTSTGDARRAVVRPRGSMAEVEMSVARIVDCRGVVSDPLATRNALLRNLLDQGLAQADPLRMGFDVADDCRMIDAGGQPSARIFAVGPLTRAAFWEIMAVPDIRVQCSSLAERMLDPR